MLCFTGLVCLARSSLEGTERDTVFDHPCYLAPCPLSSGLAISPRAVPSQLCLLGDFVPFS